MDRAHLINLHSETATTAPNASALSFGEIAVCHKNSFQTRIYTKESATGSIVEFAPLVSGKTIKTINGSTIVGEGNIDITAGTFDYGELSNKPQINSITLTGNKSLDDLGIATNKLKMISYVAPSGYTEYSAITSADTINEALKKAEAINFGLTEKEDKSNKITELSSGSTDAQYPSAKCVFDYITEDERIAAEALNDLDETKEDIANKTNTITSASTVNEYPSAKAVYDFVNGYEALLAEL